MCTENFVTLSDVLLKNTPQLWEQNDILVFFIELDNYNASSPEYLDNLEKELLEKLKTPYFKKRFIVSRVVLKHILCHLLKKKSVLDIHTCKDRCGGVHILHHNELHISISYSESIIALAISKVKLGIDVEARRPLALKNTLKYLKAVPSCPDGPSDDIELLKIWTMKEAYCKFSNEGMLSVLNKEPDFNNARYTNYVLDNKYIFSIATCSGPHNINISRLEKIGAD